MHAIKKMNSRALTLSLKKYTVSPVTLVPHFLYLRLRGYVPF